MILFEKYLLNELKPIIKFIFDIRLKYDINFKNKFEDYKNISSNLKYMYLINNAEKEINQNKHLKKLDEMVNNFFVSKNQNNDILNYLNNAF